MSGGRPAPTRGPSLPVLLESIPPEGLKLLLNFGAPALAALVAPAGEEPPTFTTSLTGVLRSRLFEARLEVRGSFRVGVALACDRCLALTAAVVAGEIEESLELTDSSAQGGPEDDPGDGSLVVVDGRVDLAGFLAESFWLAWPYRFLCRPDCAGLCLTCGADLNQGPCGCLKPEG